MKKDIFKKIWQIVKWHKILRTSSLLSAIFLLFILILLLFGIFYSRQNDIYKNIIKQNKQTLSVLERLAAAQQSREKINGSLISSKSFAGSDEVVPFITYLEGIFSKADPKAEISFRSQENQIFIDHYADYKVSLKTAQDQLLASALDKLYNSRYITNIMDFSMFYEAAGKNEKNTLNRVEFGVRLFLK